VSEEQRKRRFLSLQRAFLDEAAADVDELIALLEAAPNQADGPRSCRVIAHNLRGTGACYGYARISEAAAFLEEALDTGVSSTTLRTLALRLREAVAGSEAELARVEHRAC
jgi:HPt (histidine-containing phosphotransfer) domain-containing protein